MQRLRAIARLENLHPAAFAASYVLVSFVSTPEPVLGLWRPLAVAIAFAVLIQLTFTAVLRNASRGALAASAVVVVLAQAWLVATVAAAFAVWWVVVAGLRRRRGDERLPFGGVAPARWAGVLGAFLLLVSVASTVPVVLPEVRIPVASSRAAADAGPNVYVIVLDGYPRSDVLATVFDYDNAWFESALEERGFDVASESRSNYTATWASLASMLHGRYLDEIEQIVPFPADAADQYRELMSLIREGPMLEVFRSRGYEIVTVPAPFQSTAITTADRYLSGGQPTSFEISLLTHTAPGELIAGLLERFLASQHRARVVDALEAPVRVAAEARSTPVLMLTHVLSPHAPHLFDADGGSVPLPECYPQTCTFWVGHWEDLPGQLHHLNSLVLEAVDGITASDPEASILILSDHGSQPSTAPQSVKVQNLFAARVPGHAALYPEDVSLVSVFPALLEAYWGEPHSPRDYRGWYSVPEQPLTMTPIGN